jgi:hypothetical protein
MKRATLVTLALITLALITLALITLALITLALITLAGRAMKARVVLATALAISLAGAPAWGHTFPPVHTVVVQVERCEVVLLIGYTAGTGDSTERIVARVASQPKSHAVDALRDTLTAYALAPFAITVDGAPLAPTSLRAKVGVDPSGTRPMVVVLVTYPLPRGDRLAITSNDPRTTRISWRDQASGRIALDAAPSEGRWHAGVASFLLPLAAGGSACATSASSASSPARSPAR